MIYGRNLVMTLFFMLLLLIPFDTFYDVFVPCAYL